MGENWPLLQIRRKRLKNIMNVGKQKAQQKKWKYITKLNQLLWKK